jgi:hypothetical protein
MATINQTPATWRGQVLRSGWDRAGNYTSRAFHQVFTFFSTYPPLAQGLYYLAIGLWPLVSIRSYQEVTGARADVWVAQAVAVLLLAIGSTLCLAAYRRQGSPEVLLLAFGSALGLTAVDIHLVWRGYSALYLLDAALQLGLVAFWVYGWRRSARATPTAAVAGQAPPTAAS